MLSMKKSNLILGALRVPLDYIAAVISFLLAYHIRPVTDLIPWVQYQFGPELLPTFSDYILFALWSPALLILLFAWNGLYSLRRLNKILDIFPRIFLLVSIWLLFIIAYYFLIVHELFFSRIALLHIWLFSNFFIFLGRVIVYLIKKILIHLRVGRRRILLVGCSKLSQSFYCEIKNDPNYEVVGMLVDQLRSTKKGDLKILGSLQDYEKVVRKYSIEEVVQAMPELKNIKAVDLYDYCRQNQIQYHFIPDLIRLQQGNVEVQMLGDMPLVSLKESSFNEWDYLFKRVFDIILSFILILLLTPVWLLVPLFIWIDSPGSIYYKSRRKFRDKVFHIYKFRSMVPNADKIKKDLLELNERKGPLFKIKNDPRITRVGKWLRKTSIDELPQLFNVLKGDLSLVGPRPHMPEEVDQYEKHHLKVFAVKPGVTGLAQINGRSNLDFEEEVKLDLYYIENWSIWLDFIIILKSALVVLKADGA